GLLKGGDPLLGRIESDAFHLVLGFLESAPQVADNLAGSPWMVLEQVAVDLPAELENCGRTQRLRIAGVDGGSVKGDSLATEDLTGEQYPEDEFFPFRSEFQTLDRSTFQEIEPFCFLAFTENKSAFFIQLLNQQGLDLSKFLIGEKGK
ncbi:MAG: hypothetical protein AABZ22_05620, partial [Nitrospirota bacterium]